MLHEGAAKIRTMSYPQRIQATILDLNGNPLRACHPTPILRRTTSGHLFQPSNEVVKASEMMAAVPVTLGEVVQSPRRPIRKVIVVQKAKRRKDGSMNKKVRFQMSSMTGDTSTPSASVPSTTSQQSRVAVAASIHECQFEDKGHRCMTDQLVNYSRPDSETLGTIMNTVSIIERIVRVLDDADDV